MNAPAKPASNCKRSIRLTQTALTGGCGCKIAPGRLQELLMSAGVLMPQNRPPRLLAGAENAEDAAVWQVSDDCALVATADFFAPMADVPRDFGRAAAANALSDIYAMGASPMFALALAAMPSAVLDDDDIAEIFAGGADVCRQAGIVVAGGHSIDSAEPLYGLAAIGQVHPQNIMTNGGAREHDVLILTKPVGIGLMSAAHRKNELPDHDYQIMIQAITTLNKVGEQIARIDSARAMTDVTGFGLLGHALEMCRASSLGAKLFADAVPFFARAKTLAEQGSRTGASNRNWQSYGSHIKVKGKLPEWLQTLLTDPQTGGGLLIACAPDAQEEVLQTLKSANSLFDNAPAVVGRFVRGEGIEVE